MTCPACRESVPSGHERCPSCGAVVAPATEGALAPHALGDTPPPHAKAEPLREIPGLKKKEKAAWKEEVRERVRHRRRRENQALPLFDVKEPVAPHGDPARESAGERLPPAPAVGPEDLSDDDLSLRPPDAPSLDEEVARAVTFRTGPVFDDAVFEGTPTPSDDWSVDAASPPEARPVERPAHAVERVQTAAIDAGLLLGIAAFVVYFASRAAHTTVLGLRPAWPFLLGYLAFLGLVYATYFTGTTGQTLGKIAVGLRVVDRAGHPPGYVRALCRATLGIFGILAGFVGVVPMFFDPARRALHDRIFRTRVVRN
jgi:uncharacterized RDD family membrane protein YckC